jgi:hypothetical protein
VYQPPAEVVTALRVLNALALKRDPNLADIDELRHLAPQFAATPLDVLAWGVIQQVASDR